MFFCFKVALKSISAIRETLITDLRFGYSQQTLKILPEFQLFLVLLKLSVSQFWAQWLVSEHSSSSFSFAVSPSRMSWIIISSDMTASVAATQSSKEHRHTSHFFGINCWSRIRSSSSGLFQCRQRMGHLQCLHPRILLKNQIHHSTQAQESSSLFKNRNSRKRFIFVNSVDQLLHYSVSVLCL